MRIKAPYDMRNEADYKLMTKKINAALDQIESNSSLNATEKALCTLVGCSRGTLRNRIYPLQRLKKIKEQRRAKSRAGLILDDFAQKFPKKTGSESIEFLKREIDLCNTENAILLNKYFLKQAECREVMRHVALLRKSKQLAEDEIRRLRGLLARAEILQIDVLESV